MTVLDLFAGPGGWSEGLRVLGLTDIGIEIDPAACATRAAAGHTTIRTDVADYPTAPLRGKVTGLIASPPCQTFSAAGLRAGNVDRDLCHQGLDDLARGKDTRTVLRDACADPRSLLVVEPLRYALDLRPDWIALEEVPAVAPLFAHVAGILRGLGYSAWTGVLNAADYGVPQTRRRAFLLASRTRTATPPEPTHTQDPGPDTLFGPALAPWVTMADALGWGATDRPVPTVTAGGGKSGGPEPFPTSARKALMDAQRRGSWVLHTNRNQMPDGTRQTTDPHSAPAPTFTAKAGGQWVLRHSNRRNATVRRADEPAATLLFAKASNDVSWHKDGPAGPESVRITVQEAAALQTFPTGYPFQGTKTRQFEQIGNAVPPLLATAVLRPLVPAVLGVAA
ncbi:DNA cytosine methyltransferase [Streptomyces heilongjiangensis]|uniref:DNA (cytosine-5-)-methyltransferase n=1 Tax=Streptomyces heilongjiangensis TaxID=945052 RepID=A0ABW1BI39_9ACTN|nr:DNA cytosine methyltransferase [Streptomyces heilongjiangensis]MDC2951231.1 DNA cytosine methyltransferase [Streptomyces heilongjiangensis]